MKNKLTFDIPAYKFAILKVTGSYKNQIDLYSHNLEKVEKITNQAIENNFVELIPFEYVDGLTVEETQQVLKLTSPILTCCYVEYSSITAGDDTKQRIINILHTLVLSKEETGNNPTTKIDELIEKSWEKIYSVVNDKAKRIIRCFFERYQDASHQETVERVKKLSK